MSSEKHEAYEAFASHEMMSKLAGSGRKGLDIICIPNIHNCKISGAKLSSISAAEHLKQNQDTGSKVGECLCQFLPALLVFVRLCHKFDVT